MTQHRERRTLPYPADDMLGLVANIERYPDFIPWCRSMRILSREMRDGKEIVTAEMGISFKVYRERFTSEVTSDRAARTISIRYLDGPFRYLNNDWAFEETEDGCIVDFFIDFEFKSRTLQMLIGLVFEEAVRRMIGAFEARARVLYGRRKVRAD